MRKPETCKGCDWYGNGHGFLLRAHHEQETSNTILLLGPHPFKADVECGKLGTSHPYQFITECFPRSSGAEVSQLHFDTLVNCRGLATKDTLIESIPGTVIEHCAQYQRRARSYSLIVVLGEVTFRAVTNNTLRAPNGKPASFEDWRGFIIPYEYTQHLYGHIPVYVSHHPAEFHFNPSAERLTEWDWIKIRGILDGSYPKSLPPNLISTADTITHTLEWFHHAHTAQWVTCDTEFIPESQYLTMVGLLARFTDGRVSGLQIDWRTADPGLKREFSRRYEQLVKHVPMVFHNCRADIPVLRQAFGVDWTSYKQYDDTMLAHAVLWCELPHSLEFIASVWGWYPKMKHMKNQDELFYNFGDILETDAIWHTITTSSFKHDPQAEQVYRSQHLKLCPILDDTVSRGLRVNAARVQQARAEYEQHVKNAELLATACAGWPININSSQQIAWYLYTIRGLDIQKHKKTKGITTDDAAIATLRMALGPPYDPDEDLTYEMAVQRIQQGADPILEARVLYAGAQTRLIKYIYPLFTGVAQAHTDKARDQAIADIRAGIASPVLARIHPDMLIHTQKTGRWSTVDPPIAQLPADLRDLVCPDEKEVWVHWDWSSIEPRVLEGLCHSRILKRSFDEGIDLHTWTVCKLFNYTFPPNLVDPHAAPENTAWRVKYGWKGSDDPRRVFAKTGRYEMYYGGTGANAANAAALFGLDPKMLKRALDGLLSADPEYYTWRLQLESDLKRTRMIRTFMGRPRRFLKGGDKMIREGLDQPMQGAVSDIANTTVIQLHERFRHNGFQFAWSMHDSQYWHCPEGLCTPDFLESVRSIAARSHIINGRAIPFPIKYDIIYPPEHKGVTIEHSPARH